MLSDIKNGMATFVMPHFRYENVKSKHFLDKAIDGIMAQTDQNFKLVIVDDLSPCKEAITYLSELKNKYPKKIHIILKSTNTGAGNSRNIAIKWAYENKSPIILYNDQDDISHPQRLEIVRKEFIKDAEATVVYSTFTVIDEEGEIVSKEYLSQDIQEILEGHTNNIVQGKNSWIALGTEKNYTNLTSSTAVKTEVAYKYPFPNVPTCEDSHTWFRYGAHPGNFVYVPNIPSLYRIPDKINSSSRIIFTNFYKLMAENDAMGFKEAMNIAIENKTICLSEVEKDEILIKFYIKLGETLNKAGQAVLAKQQFKIASEINFSIAKKLFNNKKLPSDLWVE